MGQVDDETVGLLLYPPDDHQCLAEVALGVSRRMGQGHEHLPRPTAMLPHVVLDDGVLAIKPVLVPQPLEDALGGVALLLEDLMILIQDVVDDSGEGLLLSLSKGWVFWAESVAGSPEARSRPASCAPCPGAGQTLWRPPECSCPPPSPPGEPADIRPPCTSVAPSMGSATTLWKMTGGTVFNRPMSVGQPAHMAQFTSAAYRAAAGLPGGPGASPRPGGDADHVAGRAARRRDRGLEWRDIDLAAGTLLARRG